MAGNAHKGKRKKEWGANEKARKLPKKSAVFQVDNQGNVSWIGTSQDLGAIFDWLFEWTRDMHAWGQDVRDDIVRLEGHAGFATGDPGDPPDGPPGDD